MPTSLDTRKTAGILALTASAALILAVTIGAARSEPSPFADPSRGPSWGLGSTPSAIARRYLGRTGPQLGLPSSLWCADFVNLVRKEAGLRAVASRRAFDQARHGRRIARPRVDALLITPRGRGGGHVEWIVAVNADGSVTTIGGNVDRVVAERVRPAIGIIIEPM